LSDHPKKKTRGRFSAQANDIGDGAIVPLICLTRQALTRSEEFGDIETRSMDAGG
jgi:hypothetical protein